MTEPTPTTTQPTTSAPTVTTGVLEQLVGPGKKFQDQEALAKGKLEADQFIAKTTEENKQLRNLLAQQAQENEMLKARASILDRATNTGDPASNPSGSNQQPTQTTSAPGLTADDVVQLIEQSKKHEVATENVRKVDAILIKTLGADAPAFVTQKAAELGMDIKDLYNVAIKSPNGFLNLLGINPNGAAPGSSMYVAGNAAGNNGTNQPVRNKSYYDKIQKEKGTVKFMLDTSLQTQLHKDMQTLGDAFFT